MCSLTTVQCGATPAYPRSLLFGIKTTGDARDTVERVNANAKKTRRTTMGGGNNKKGG